jgi:O-antigen/teichoic acid export membrane protein
MIFFSKYKTYITFTLSSSIYNIALIITNFIAIKWVLPKDIGLWNSVFLFSNYIALIQLGVFNTINRDIPYYYGKNEIDKVEQIVKVGSWFARLLFQVVIVLTLLTLIYLFITQKSDDLKITVLSIGLITALSFYQNFLIVTYRTSSQFGKLANIYLYQSIVVVASLALVIFWSYYGFVLRNFILVFFFFFFAFKNRPFKLSPSLVFNFTSSYML